MKEDALPSIRAGGPGSRVRRGGMMAATLSQPKSWPKMKDPSGGTTGRVKAIWALGVDGRSRLIQPMGRDCRSHEYKSRHPHRRSKHLAIFLDLLAGIPIPPTAEHARKFTGKRSFSGRSRWICRMPSLAHPRSAPCSQKCYCGRTLSTLAAYPSSRRPEPTRRLQ